MSPLDERALTPVPPRLVAHLMERERALHFPPSGTSRADFEAGVAEGYWEVGASGGRFDTEVIWDVVRRRAAGDSSAFGDLGADPPWETHEEECRLLAPRTYLLTYLLVQGERRTRRVSIWRGAGADWVAAYHQGTPVTGRW